MNLQTQIISVIHAFCAGRIDVAQMYQQIAEYRICNDPSNEEAIRAELDADLSRLDTLKANQEDFRLRTVTPLRAGLDSYHGGEVHRFGEHHRAAPALVRPDYRRLIPPA